jgi:two-component system NtrC family sensor kinase
VGVGELIFEQASEAIVVASADGVVTAWNAAAERMHGIAAGEAIGRRIDEMLLIRSIEGVAVVKSVWATLRTGQGWTARVVQRPLIGTRAGQETVVDAVVRPVPYGAGKFGGVFFGLDVASSDRRSEELLQAQKMEAIGLLVSGVKHELNNPLASILAFSQLIRTDQSLPPELRDQADLLIQEARRTHRIVNGLLDFARQGPSERRPMSLRAIVDEVLALQSYTFRPGRIETIVEIPEDIPTIPLDRAQIEQVLVNLTLNAAQAIQARSEHGTIRIVAERATTDAGGDVVRMSITDDGPGVPPDLRSHLFVPFLVTKAPGDGPGLGLSVSFGIIAGHGGTLRHEAGPGGVGATFIIELPVSPDGSPTERTDPAEPAASRSGKRRAHPSTAASDDPTAAGPAPASVSPATAIPAPATPAPAIAPGGGAPLRILVLDDEASIRDFLARILRRNGYEPIAAIDGASALEIVRSNPPRAILCDHRMAGMTGIAFHEAVAAIDASLARRFAFMSGDVLNAELHEFAVSRGIVLLAKPFDIETVGRTVAQIAT